MKKMLNIRGRLVGLERPRVMGIINVTPDSFYAASRVKEAEDIRRRARQMLDDGADILDIGGYSTRPGAGEVSADEEYSRLARALECIREVAPNAILSVDTFRADVARRCVEDWNVDIINDIGNGSLDPEMFDVVADLRCVYVLMHSRGCPETMQSMTDYEDVSAETLENLAFRLDELRQKGVKDVIIDPGFGFAKTVEQNYELLHDLSTFKALDCPILVGFSRKSMIWKTLGCTPEDSAHGTTALNTMALMQGADILRVHDVRPAVDTVNLFMASGFKSENQQNRVRIIRKR